MCRFSRAVPGLFFCLCLIIFSMLPSCQGRRSQTSQGDANVLLAKELGIIVPNGAVNVKCSSEALMVKWVYARLDMQASELGSLLKQGVLAKLPLLEQNAEIQRTLEMTANDIDWWRLPEGQLVKVGQSSWRIRTPKSWSSDLECTAGVAVAQKADLAQVYIQYSEETVSKNTVEANSPDTDNP